MQASRGSQISGTVESTRANRVVGRRGELPTVESENVMACIPTSKSRPELLGAKVKKLSLGINLD